MTSTTARSPRSVRADRDRRRRAVAAAPRRSRGRRAATAAGRAATRSARRARDRCARSRRSPGWRSAPPPSTTRDRRRTRGGAGRRVLRADVEPVVEEAEDEAPVDDLVRATSGSRRCGSVAQRPPARRAGRARRRPDRARHPCRALPRGRKRGRSPSARSWKRLAPLFSRGTTVPPIAKETTVKSTVDGEDPARPGAIR